MILMGAGTNHWFHSDQTYRSFLALVMLTGCRASTAAAGRTTSGRRSAGRSPAGRRWRSALDWQRPPRQMQGTVVLVPGDRPVALRPVHRGGDGLPAGRRPVPRAGGRQHRAGQPAGLDASHPTFNRNPLDLADEAQRLGKERRRDVVDGLKTGQLRFACEDPDAPENFPRCLTVWRANLLGSSAKGNEYFLRHLLGTDERGARRRAPERLRPARGALARRGAGGQARPADVARFPDDQHHVFSDIVLPAATWYEKHDLSSTDMHPFVHAFSPAISPPWETRTDFEAFTTIAGRSPGWAEAPGRAQRHRGRAAAARHRRRTAQPGGRVLDWKPASASRYPARPCRGWSSWSATTPAVGDKMAALGPMVERWA